MAEAQTYFNSKKRWFKKTGSNVVDPMKITTSPKSSSISSTLIGSPSPVKALFPSPSMFNLPTTSTPIYTQPPPQFAVDPFKRDKVLKKLKPRSKIEKGYPSAFETYLFDDVVPGTNLKQGIRPVRLLIERLEAWHLLSKRLLYHFELLASIESKVAKSYRKLDTATIFPSPHHTTSNYHYHRHRVFKKAQYRLAISNRKQYYKGERLLQIHFNFNTGVKSICDAWQKYHVDNTLDHAACATFLRNEAIPILRNIKHELKWMIRSIQQDDRLSLTALTRLKREAAKRLKKLDCQLVFFDEHPYHSYCKKDPWLMNAAVVKEMVKVYRQENKMHETVIRLQREILVSEDQIVLELKHICQQMHQLRESSNLGVDKGIQHIVTTINDIQSDWKNFHQDHQEHLVSEYAAFRHPDHLQYPNHTHALLQPIFAARMERKSRFRNKWHESIYVLTEAGYLHEFAQPNSYPAHPSASIFIPHYKVSSTTTHLHHSLIFELHPAPRKSLSKQKSVALKQWHQTTPRLGCHDHWSWVLRAKSAEDMDSWVQHLTRCSERFRQPFATPEIILTVPEPEAEDIESKATPADDVVAEPEGETTPAEVSEEVQVDEQPVPEEEEEEASAENEEPPVKEDPEVVVAAPAEEEAPTEEIKQQEEESRCEEKIENAVFE